MKGGAELTILIPSVRAVICFLEELQGEWGVSTPDNFSLSIHEKYQICGLEF
jgi:hypothetical protein